MNRRRRCLIAALIVGALTLTTLALIAGATYAGLENLE